MLTITTALFAGSVYHVLLQYIVIVLNIIPTLYEGFIVSVHRMVKEIVLLTLAASRGVTDLYLS